MSNLSQQEKNDIIATRICEGRYIGFNPCNSLDDCFLAEEKMTGDQQAAYVDILWRSLDENSESTNETIWHMLHASAEERVNAMLKALDIS